MAAGPLPLARLREVCSIVAVAAIMWDDCRRRARRTVVGFPLLTTLRGGLGSTLLSEAGGTGRGVAEAAADLPPLRRPHVGRGGN